MLRAALVPEGGEASELVVVAAAAAVTYVLGQVRYRPDAWRPRNDHPVSGMSAAFCLMDGRSLLVAQISARISLLICRSKTSPAISLRLSLSGSATP